MQSTSLAYSMLERTRDMRNRWLTPSELGGGTQCRPLSFPVELWPHVNGAIEELLNPWNWEQSDEGATIDDVVAALYDSVTEFPGECPVTISPSVYRLILPQAYKVSGNADVWTTVGATIWQAGYWQSTTPSLNDRWDFYIPLAAYTYEVRLVVMRSAAAPIVSFMLNDVLQWDMDLYNSANIHNAILSGGTITIDEDGINKLSLKAGSKNASSTGYTFRMIEMWLRPT